jgi:hypothetical protein
MAKEIHMKHLGMGIEKGEIPGFHCPVYPSADYSIRPWYTEDRREKVFNIPMKAFG